MTHLQSRLSTTRTLERHEFLRFIKLAFSKSEFHFASQVALDWLTEYPGDLPFRYWYGKARAAEGHFSLAASILDEVLQADPEYLDAVRARLEVENQLSSLPGKTLKSSTPPGQPNRNQLNDLQEWLFAISGETTILPKRPYSSLQRRWGEELYALQKTLPPTAIAPLDYEKAEHTLHELIAAKPDHPLIAVFLLKNLYIQFQQGSLTLPAFRNIVEHYLAQFPHCLYIHCLQVEVQMSGGEPERAVASLHSLAARDLSAQVAQRVWGSQHQYLTIWPRQLFKTLNVQIPASISAILGLNQLPVEIQQSPSSHFPRGDEISTPLPTAATPVSKDAAASSSDGGLPPSPAIPVQLAGIQDSLNKISQQLRKPELQNLDGRFPVYVILTSRQNLRLKYGNESIQTIEKALFQFLSAVSAQKGWKGLLFYADQGKVFPASSTLTSLTPAKPNDPWSIKRSLMELDTALARQGEMIGALLIVGGDDVIPFHRLPNPIEDGDDDVPSDNPYGSRNENYYVMDWPVGRLPCPDGDPAFLVELLSNYTAKYTSPVRKSARRPLSPLPFDWFFSWARFLAELFNHKPQPITSFGYTAASWRFASFSVFGEIGQPQRMLISPHFQSKVKSAQAAKRRLVRHTKTNIALADAPPSVNQVKTAELTRTPEVQIPAVFAGYFNLHGIADSAEWFGQSDPTESGFDPFDQPDHPVALQPGDILLNPEGAIQIVLSEACFGAHILHKSVEQSIALSFLKKGCQAFIGSTCTAYGSNDTPLIAADFLAQSFWKLVRQGLPAGEALRRAKITLAETFNRTNGGLDAEDQKTLISFVLYGDPLAQVGHSDKSPKILRHVAKSLPAFTHQPCDHAMRSYTSGQISPQMEGYVKKLVEKYLPGMEQAQIELLAEENDCAEVCPNCKIRSISPPYASSPRKNGKTRDQNKTSRKVIILSKQCQVQTHHYTRYARLTLDSNGKVLKIAVSK